MLCWAVYVSAYFLILLPLLTRRTIALLRSRPVKSSGPDATPTAEKWHMKLNEQDASRLLAALIIMR
jgi:hypothetical protein